MVEASNTNQGSVKAHSSMSRISLKDYRVQLVLLAITYFITGKLGALLAIPPGYATAIWPPSGIALAAILLWGYRVWPAILVGSFLINIATSYTGGSGSEAMLSILLSAVIGVGATLQAIVGGFLLFRFAGFPNHVASGREVIALMFFGGVVSTLTNSSLSVLTLLLLGKIGMETALEHWLTWWVGDAMGVIIFTPLILAWMLQPSEAWSKRRFSISLTILVTFTVTLMLISFEVRREQRYLAEEFNKDAKEYINALQNSVSMHFGVLRALGSFYDASDYVDVREFKVFTQEAVYEHQGIQALSWNPYVTDAGRNEFERRMRSNIPGFRITERNEAGQLVTAGKREAYVPVGYIEPLVGNERALGFDVMSNPVRREALLRARDSGEIAVTGRITLVQESGSQFGVLAFLPIYKKETDADRTDERMRNIAGFVVAVFRGGDIVNDALQDVSQFHPTLLAYRLLDLSAPEGEQELYAMVPASMRMSAGDTAQRLFDNHSELHLKERFELGGRSWQFEVVPTPGYLAEHKTDGAWFVLFTGLIFNLMAGSIVLLMSGRENSLRQLVAERTAEVQASYDQLNKLSSQVPGFLFQFRRFADGRSCFPYASAGISNIYGLTPEQVKEDASPLFGLIHPDDYERVSDSILLSARELTAWEQEYRVNLPGKGVQWLHGKSQPETLQDGSVLWHGFITNVTARKNVEAIFHGIFDQSSYFAWLLDQDSQLIEVNSAALGITTVGRADVLGRYFPDTPWWAQSKDRAVLVHAQNKAFEGGRYSFEAAYRLPDDTSLHVLFSATPIRLEDKNYVFVTGVDISERKQLESELRVLTTATEQGPASVVITDLEGNIVYVNARFTEVTGYSAAEVIGKNPRLLQSGLTDHTVYSDMWDKLVRGKRWVGELINKRKNGEIYYEEAYISPVKGEDGRVEHYVAVKLEITERKSLEEEIRKLAFYDPLTGLPNRRLLNDRLIQTMAVSKRHNVHCALIFLDMDNFKPLNDEYGHEVGDRMLVEVAGRLKHCIRSMDTVARFGGDEFVILLGELDQDKEVSVSQARKVAEKILEALSEPYLLRVEQEGMLIRHVSSASLGVAVFMDHLVSVAEVLKWADAAMYQAKAGGRNQICFHERGQQQV